MRTTNRLIVRMSCPICGDFSQIEGELYFGDTTSRWTYTLGDRCHWLPNRSSEDGGRPESGVMDSEAFLRCENCGHDFFASVAIRNDIIADVIVELEKSGIVYLPPTQPVQAVREASLNTPSRGEIKFEFTAEWLTPQRQAVLEQLTERGVTLYDPNPLVESTDWDFRILIPHDLKATEYIEIAYLIAQLLDEKYQRPLIEYVDSYPLGLKYRVRQESL